MDTDYKTIANISLLANEAYRVLANFNAYYTISGYKEATEIANALEWLIKTAHVFKCNSK